jgi:N-glycosylase/DNA lyase
MKDLLELYNKRKNKIRKRLLEFKENKKDKNRIFSELCFCLLTPQSKAELCDKAIINLEKNNLLFWGNEKEISNLLRGVRFHNKKSRYIIESRKFKDDIKKIIDSREPRESREWLVKNIKGLNYKESSHFLRNVGLGNNLAILDRHILSNLREYQIIKKVPKTLSWKRYLEIENKMKSFSDKIKIPLEELDLLFWSKKTGKIFK